MSILFKGNLEEGNYTLIKSTDGWVLKGETSYVGFNFADRPQGKWIVRFPYEDTGNTRTCSNCNITQTVNVYDGVVRFKFCPYCGARMKGAKGADDE